MSTNLQPQIPSKSGDPTWEAAMLFPNQGRWNESDFFRLHTNRMAELVDGYLEILPMPTWLHQLIVRFIVKAIESHMAEQNLSGDVLFAPLPVSLFQGTIREPDVLYVAPENLPGPGENYPSRIDFAVEVVSSGADARNRDYVDKRRDYAKAGVPEYWIVDPEAGVITVLTLMGEVYETLGEFRDGDVAESRYFAGLKIQVADILALGDSTRRE